MYLHFFLYSIFNFLYFLCTTFILKCYLAISARTFAICSLKINQSIPTELVAQSLDSLIHKIDAHGTTDRHPGHGRPKSVRTTDNIAVRAGLDLQSRRRSYASCSMASIIVGQIIKYCFLQSI